MRARPETALDLRRPVLDFVERTNRLTGTEGSTVHRSANDPLTWFLLERFRDQEILSGHIAGEHFRRFQFAQQTYLVAPVEVFLAGTRP